jgi:zinc and cadmium transporter
VPQASLPALISVLVVSLISFVGATALALGPRRVRTLLPLLVAMAAGALLGGALLHLLPEAAEQAGGFDRRVATWTLAGVLGFFVIESVIHWHHHGEDVEEHGEGGVASFVWMNLIGDGVHNCIDGALIAGTWMLSPSAGLVTTIAVSLHEVPQEFGDFGVLLHGGLPVGKALLLNFASAMLAFVGAVGVLLTGGALHLEPALVPLAAGGFLYVACADLVPELHKRATRKDLLFRSLAMAVGLALVIVLPLLVGEGGHAHAGPGTEPAGQSAPGH